MIYKDKDTIYEEINTDFNSVGINNLSPLSPGNIIASNFSDNVSDIYNEVAEIEEDLNPSRYTSNKLTEQGAKYGIKRTDVIPMRDNTFSNFRFKLSNDKIAQDITLDPTAGFIVPKGTLITGSNGERFYTTDAAEFEPEDNTVFVRIYSVTDISATSIDTNVLSTHDATLSSLNNVDPDKVQNVTLGCTNTKAIVSESVSLSDDEMKKLLSYEYNSPNAINEDKVMSAVLRVPGVSSATVIENFNGIGSVAVSVKPTNPIASEGLYVAIESSLAANVIGGNSIEVLRPEYLKVGICVTIKLNEAIDDVDTFYNEVKLFMATIINAISQGSVYDIEGVDTLTKENYDEIESITTTCLSINGKRALLQPQQALDEQKFIIFDPEIDIDINASFSE